MQQVVTRLSQACWVKAGLEDLPTRLSQGVDKVVSIRPRLPKVTTMLSQGYYKVVAMVTTFSQGCNKLGISVWIE